MGKSKLVLTAILAWAGVAMAEEPAKGHPDSSKWDNVFADDLSDAVFPKGIWAIEDGALTATQDQCIWTKKEYENFVVDLEFKTAPGTNSGVIVYCSDVGNWIPSAVEIQILDDHDPGAAKMSPTWKCAAIFGHAAPTKSTVKKPGEWNRMTVTCKGQSIAVMLNGETVTEIDMKNWTSAKKNPDGSDIPPWLSRPMSELPTKGRIGFQGKHGGKPIYFRNLKIKTIE